MKNIVILTGSGISAESGLKTFRSEDGLWLNHRVEDVCTVEAFERNPALVRVRWPPFQKSPFSVTYRTFKI